MWLQDLAHRRRTGEGTLVEAAMVDAALAIAAEQVVEHSAHGALLQRDGNRSPVAAPQNLYPTADLDEDGSRDAWVAISVATDDQWLALRDALGRPEWARDESLLGAAGRRAQHDALDAHLSTWCAGRTAAEVVDVLWGAGVPVARVLQPHEQPTLPPLQHRGFFESVDHPVAGAARHSTLPFRSSRDPERFHRSAAPLLGEHTEAILGELGVSPDDLAGLRETGVIGDVPDLARR